MCATNHLYFIIVCDTMIDHLYWLVAALILIDESPLGLRFFFFNLLLFPYDYDYYLRRVLLALVNKI